MSFTLVWPEGAADTFHELEAAAQKSLHNRQKSKFWCYGPKTGAITIVAITPYA